MFPEIKPGNKYRTNRGDELEVIAVGEQQVFVRWMHVNKETAVSLEYVRVCTQTYPEPLPPGLTRLSSTEFEFRDEYGNALKISPLPPGTDTIEDRVHLSTNGSRGVYIPVATLSLALEKLLGYE